MEQLADRVRSLKGSMLAIAVTATFSQLAFARSLGIDFPLLSDWSREVSGTYGVRYEIWKGHDGLAKRSIFVLDHDRIVRYRWVADDALVQPDLAAVAEAVEAVGARSTDPDRQPPADR